MRLSQLFTKTLRQAPRDEESRSAQLLLRAGFIHKEMAGVYSFLPLGLIVLRRIEQIVREEMDAIGAQELQMTTLQPKDVWMESGRWDDKEVDAWFKTKLQNGTELGLGWTHEEPMTRIARNYINSYKDMPILAYQFQWKLRNELRAKSGIMRCREFLMKDLYSFAATQEQHDELYERIKEAYRKVFDRLGIGKDTIYTYASGGPFSKFSHEYQTVLEVGEDTIHVDDKHMIAVNEEIMNPETLQQMGLGNAKMRTVKAAEVGNIFPLGTRFTEPLGVHFSDEKGNDQLPIMGSYGIGVSRLMGVLAEYFADDKGLVWPEAVAPAQVHLISLGDEAVKVADKLYDDLRQTGFSVLYDDRDQAAGAKFADADLIGCPVRVTVSQKTLAQDSAEVKRRDKDNLELMPLKSLISKLNSPS